MIVLSRSICAAPQRGFDDVQAEHGALTKRLSQRRVVIEPQITFKPNNAVTHVGANGLCAALSRRLADEATASRRLYKKLSKAR
mgnify:CR=1 FL=1